MRDYILIQDELFEELTIDDMYEQAKRRQKQQPLPNLKAKVSALLDRVPDRTVPEWDELSTPPAAAPDRGDRPAD